MKKTFLFIPYIFLLSIFSKADTIYVESKIKSANVYFQGAELNRHATLNINKGKHTLIFDKLPYEISEDEYQVKSSYTEAVVSLKLDKIKGKQKGKSPKTKSLEASIDLLIEESKDINHKAMILDKKKEILLSNSTTHAKNEGVNLDKLEKALQYFELKLNSIREERLRLKQRLKEIETEILNLQKEIQNTIRETNQNYSRIIVMLNLGETKEINFNVTYFLQTAGWRPNYNVKVEDINKPLSLEFQAELFQTTGENWDNIQLNLGELKPECQSNFPVFKPWIIENGVEKNDQKNIHYSKLEGIIGNATTGDLLPFSELELYKDEKFVKRVLTDKNGKFVLNPILTGYYSIIIKNSGFTTLKKELYIKNQKKNVLEIGMKEGLSELVQVDDISAKPIRGVDNIAVNTGGISQADQGGALTVRGGRSDQTIYFIDGVKVLGSPSINLSPMVQKIHIDNQIEEQQFNRHYTLKAPHSILSNGEEYTLRIKTIDIPTEYEYFVFAKEDPSAFLKGKIANIFQYQLFNGQANIYFKGKYIGQTYLETKTFSDTTHLFLGKDNDILVKRNKHIKSNTNQFMTNGKTKSDLHVDIEIKNNKKHSINLTVIDQIPVTELKDIGIALLESGGAKLDKKKGKLEWNKVLKPSEKQNISFQYVTKYAKMVSKY